MRPAILERVASMGFKVFDGEMNVNIVGVRSVSRESNSFDDRLHLCYQTADQWTEHVYPITTDPGAYWLKNPMRVEGTAILVPGQYRGAYQLGKHRGQYDALVQTGGEVAVYRDGDRDTVLDPHSQEPSWGYFGINIHRASSKHTSSSVEKWSAGCQVFADPVNFEHFLSVVTASMKLYGDRVTYTLIGD